MSIEVMRYVWTHSKSKANARLMLLAIADIANDNGDAYPGVDKLGTKCNISHRCAQEVIQDLERLGELLVFENVGTKTISGWTNLYRVVLEGVNQGVIRNPKGEIATARRPTPKKTKAFPKGMQPDAPLEGMQQDARHEVQPDACDDVQPDAPKSSEYSSGDTSDNTHKPKSQAIGQPFFEVIAKGAFEVSDLKGLSKGSRSRIGLLAKIAKSLITARFPKIDDCDAVILIAKYCAAENFKPNLQGATKFEMGLAAFLEKNAPYIPSYLAQQRAIAEREAKLIADDGGEFVDPEMVKAKMAEVLAALNSKKAAS